MLKWMLLLVMSLASFQAQAQSAEEINPQQLLAAATQVAGRIDQQQLADLWDGASAVTRQQVARDAFVASTSQSRKPLGAMTQRAWASISLHQLPAGGAPAGGFYASVEFTTRFSNQQTRRELISFRRDEDGIWRFSGYVVR